MDRNAACVSALAEGRVYWIYGIFMRAGVVDADRDDGGHVILQAFNPPQVQVFGFQEFTAAPRLFARSLSLAGQTVAFLAREVRLYRAGLRRRRARKAS